MTYQPKDLSVLAYANGFTLWHYSTADCAAAMSAAGAWDAAADMLRAGDIILANVNTARHPEALMLLVSGSAPGRVAIIPMASTPCRSLPELLS